MQRVCLYSPMCTAIYPNILFAWSFEKYAQSFERIDRMAVIALFGRLIYWISLSVAMKIFSVENKNSKRHHHYRFSRIFFETKLFIDGDTFVFALDKAAFLLNRKEQTYRKNLYKNTPKSNKRTSKQRWRKKM